MATFSVSNENIESIPVFVREIVRACCPQFASNPKTGTLYSIGTIISHLLGPPRSRHVIVSIRQVTGGVAGAAAKTSVAPLERCKILFQTGRLHNASVTTTLLSIKRQEGVKGLFKGNGASILRIVPYASIHFGLYEHYRRAFINMWYKEGRMSSDIADVSDSTGSSGRAISPVPTGSTASIRPQSVSPVVDLLAGSSSGATAVILTYPLDFVRTRLAYTMEANRGECQPQNIRAILRKTLQGEGLLGLYRGIGPSLYGILPYAGLKFYVYQRLKQLYFAERGLDQWAGQDHDVDCTRLPVPYMLAFGGVAGLVAQTVTYPVDVVRRRMQVEGLKAGVGRGVKGVGGARQRESSLLPRTTPNALMFIARSEGWRVLWAGLSINYAKVVPSTAIGFTLYDMLKQRLLLSNNL
jgi:hypothetical protein